MNVDSTYIDGNATPHALVLQVNCWKCGYTTRIEWLINSSDMNVTEHVGIFRKTEYLGRVGETSCSPSIFRNKRTVFDDS